jgi:hypothetical protein
MRMSSSRSALTALKPKTLPMIEAVRLAIEPLEQVEVVGDVGEVLRLGLGAGAGVGHRVDAIGLGAVQLAGGQAVGPHHGPGGGRRFAGHRGGLFGVDALLRRDPEQRAHDVGVLGHVVGLPVAHLLVLEHAGGVALLEYMRAHHVAPRVVMQMSSNEAIKQAVMAGMGVSLLSLHTLGLELNHHLIATPETEGLPIMRRWHVVNNQAKTLSPAAEAFRYFVLERGEAFLATHFPAERTPAA